MRCKSSSPASSSDRSSTHCRAGRTPAPADVVDLCVDQLESIAWGVPSEDVRMTAPRAMLEAIARDLLDGGTELLANPLGWRRPEAQSVGDRAGE